MGAITDATKVLKKSNAVPKSNKTTTKAKTSKKSTSKTTKNQEATDLLKEATVVLQHERAKQKVISNAKEVREKSIDTLPVEVQPETPKMEESVDRILSKVNLDITKKERDQIVQHMTHRDINIDSVLRICDGTLCPHFWCPFKIIKKFPLTELCPIEREIAQTITNEYFTSLGLDAAEARIVAADQILALTECHLNEMRNRGILQKEGMTQMKAAFAVKDTGEVIYNEEISIIFDLKERIAKRKDVILKQLLAYPEIRARLKIPNKDEIKNDGRSLIAKAEALLQEIKKNGDGSQ